MAQIIGQRNTNTVVSDERIVRQVADQIALLEPNQAPLLTMLMRLRKRKGIKSPRYEWFEDDYCARWASNSAAAVANTTTSTTVTVTDGTLFTAGDIFVVPKVESSASAPELCRVTVVTGNVLTVVRDVGGAGVDTIPADGALRIIGSAFEEGGTIPSAKTTAPSKKTTYLQIFRTTCEFTKTAIATEVYGAPGGDRAREHKKKLIEHKQGMNSALLFGRASESLTGGPNSKPIRTTAGLASVIASNLTNASGTLTRKTFESFSRQAFRYGSPTKMLLCAPIIKSAINEWARDFLLVKPTDTKYGVQIQQVETAHGVWLLVNDWMLENGVAGKYGYGNMGLSVDLDWVEYLYLDNNGMNRDTHLTEDAVKDGADRIIDEILTEGGFAVRNEKYHSRLYNVTDYMA